MNAQVVKQQRIGKNQDIVKLGINEGIEVSDALPILLKTIDECFKKYDCKLILDMQRIKFPSPSFIAFLIETTARARRMGGDLKLINLAPSATNNLVTFSPLSYLAVDGDEKIAREELDTLTIKRPAPKQDKHPEAPKSPQNAPKAAQSLDSPAEKMNDKGNAQEKSKKKPVKNEAQTSKGAEAGTDSDPEFRIKEIKMNLSNLTTRQKQLQTKDISIRDTDTESEPPQTKEIEIAPPKTSKEKSSVESAVKTRPQPKNENVPTVKRIRVKSKTESLYDICDFVTNLADKVGFSEKEVGKIKVTVYEACINVIEHAYHSDPDEWIVVTVQYNSHDFIIIIQDWGESFDFDDTKPYDVNKAVHDRKTGGFGLFIILRSMDEVKYKTDPVNGNRLILRKKIPKKS